MPVNRVLLVSNKSMCWTSPTVRLKRLTRNASLHCWILHTDLIKIIRDYLLEGFKSTKGIKAELFKLNTYDEYLIFVHPYLVQ